MAGKDEESNESNDGCGCNIPRAICNKLIVLLENPQDDDPIEVHIINTYAVFMGYLSMAVRGLAFLVVTWTTVILLGGFVSALGKKDFWCLTVVTLSQSVGLVFSPLQFYSCIYICSLLGFRPLIFSKKKGFRPFLLVSVLTVVNTCMHATGYLTYFSRKKLSSMWHACQGLFTATMSITFFKIPRTMLGKATMFVLRKWVGSRVGDTTTPQPQRESTLRRRKKRYACFAAVMFMTFWGLVSVVKAVVQAVLFAVILLPLAVLYLLGLYISTAISLWRLIQHDYDGKTADGSGNLKPALNVLYSLAVLQGLVFCYRYVFSRREKYLVQVVSRHWDKDIAAAPAVWEYLRETKAGCDKDPSFARCRNLATYAVDLIESSKSPTTYLSGTRILDVLLHYSDEHRFLIRHLIGWGSSGHVLQKLLATIGPKSPYDDETRNRATSIVKHLASMKEICLEQFPGGIQRISSVLDDKYEPSRVNDGLRIIGELVAGDDEDNRRVVIGTQGLLSRVMALLGSAEGLRLHPDHYCDTWDSAACIIACVIADQGEAGLKVQRQVCTSNQAIGAMGSVLKCVECRPRDRIKANDILAHLSLFAGISAQENLATPYRGRKEENLIAILADSLFSQVILIDNSVNDKNKESRKFAGEKLAELCLESKISATLILMANDHDDVFNNIMSMLLDAAGNNTMDRKSAAEILKNLCSHYTKDDKCFERLERALTDAMPKVLREVSGWSAGEEIDEITGAFSGAGTDLEKGCASQDNARNSSVSPSHEESRQQDDDYHKLKETLLSLCATVYEEMASVDEDLARRFDDMAAAMHGKPGWGFASLLKEMGEVLDKEKEARAQAEPTQLPPYFTNFPFVNLFE